MAIAGAYILDYAEVGKNGGYWIGFFTCLAINIADDFSKGWSNRE